MAQEHQLLMLKIIRLKYTAIYIYLQKTLQEGKIFVFDLAYTKQTLYYQKIKAAQRSVG